ncbi:MAG: hypothetical protein IAF08_00365 [Rhizobacter sp.]|nr:hypothetical protein [Chlorobiales bacterium]
MWKDEIVEEVCKHREAYSSQFNYDLDAIVADIKEKEKPHQDRLVSREAEKPSTDKNPVSSTK